MDVKVNRYTPPLPPRPEITSVVLTLTAEEAMVLLRLVGSISGGYTEPLQIHMSNSAQRQRVRDLITGPIYHALVKEIEGRD